MATTAQQRGHETGAARFMKPGSLDEAQRRRTTEAERVASIQAQLADKNKMLVDGQRVAPYEYHDWRKKAVFALGCATGELRRLNAWIREHNLRAMERLAGAVDFDADDPISLIGASHRLLKRLRSEGVDFDPEEEALRDALQNYVMCHGGSNGR